MIYVVHLYKCDQKHSSLFAPSFDHDGLFAEIGKDLTGHLHTQLRPHSSRPHTYLAIEFWLTEDDYRRACRSVVFRAREKWLKQALLPRCTWGIFLPRIEGSNENVTQVRNT